MSVVIVNDPFDNLDDWSGSSAFSISPAGILLASGAGAGGPQYIQHVLPCVWGAQYLFEWKCTAQPGGGAGLLYLANVPPNGFNFYSYGVGEFSEIVTAGATGVKIQLAVAGAAGSAIYQLDYMRLRRIYDNRHLVNGELITSLVNKGT